MSENAPNRREFVLDYFKSLKHYRELEYRISDKCIEKELEQLQSKIKETQKKLRAVRKNLKNARNHWFYGPLVTLVFDLNDRLENLLPVYGTTVGKSIIWLSLILSAIEIPIVTAIYFSAIITLYFADVSSSNKKQGRKYLVSEENKLFKQLEKLRAESLEFESNTDSAKAQFAVEANRLYSKIQSLEEYVQKIFKEDAKEITNGTGLLTGHTLKASTV